MHLDEAGRIAARVGGIYADSFGLTRDAAFHLGKLTEEMVQKLLAMSKPA